MSVSARFSVDCCGCDGECVSRYHIRMMHALVADTTWNQTILSLLTIVI